MAKNKIFISYRREDSLDVSARIADRLRAYFGIESTFLDFSSMHGGEDFKRHIDREMEQCRVVLVVIGDKWLDVRTEDGVRRLDQPDDMVRTEIETAIARGLPVVPVLVHNAPMPGERDFPPSISYLASRHAVSVPSTEGFHQAVNALINVLQDDYGIPPATAPTRYDLVIFPVGIILSVIGALVSLVSWVEVAEGPLMCYSTSTAYSHAARYLLAGSFCLGLGGVFVVLGKWLCCRLGTDDRVSPFPRSLGIPAQRTSGAAICTFALGVSAIGWGLPALVLMMFTGLLALFRTRTSWIMGRGLVALAFLLGFVGAAIATAYHWTIIRDIQPYYLMDQTADLLSKQSAAEAIQLADATGELLPNHGTPYLQRGEARIQQGDYHEALAELTTAIHLYQPQRGEVLDIRRDRERSLMLARAHELRANAYDELGEGIKAQKDRDLANWIREDPEDRTYTEDDTSAAEAAPAPPPAPVPSP